MSAVRTRWIRLLVAFTAALTLLLGAGPATASHGRGARPGAPGVGDE
jgi:hypothetical protein